MLRIPTDEDTWDNASDDFFYSPHFRAQHAYYLLQQKEAMKGFVKLFTLAKEMPWYKEAVINSWHLIHQLGLAENMPEGKTWLEGIMESNKWDAYDHGMNKFEV